MLAFTTNIWTLRKSIFLPFNTRELGPLCFLGRRWLKPHLWGGKHEGGLLTNDRWVCKARRRQLGTPFTTGHGSREKGALAHKYEIKGHDPVEGKRLHLCPSLHENHTLLCGYPGLLPSCTGVNPHMNTPCSHLEITALLASPRHLLCI